MLGIMTVGSEQIYQRISELQEAVRAGRQTVTATECVEAVGELEQWMAWRVNSNLAAQNLAFAIAPLCYHHPEWETALLPFLVGAALDYGCESGAGVTDWLQWNLEQAEPFGGIPEDGIAWLTGLVARPEAIQRCIDRFETDSPETGEM